ncbi:SPFH domain-containing protein [Sharpea azabuensis]|uniref:Regulator of protease activity HflC, stomatin/prohibitin superfamily n=3 Tax=Sharpea azabuensis TaxID=322505 RepID=A0A1H6Y3Y2_9FIRM|nr:SPFH domain-containing protein [Sharpea azabuensis]MEE3309007.1 SPFH domain-containing protein [Sharpea azabuensis]SEJ34594.1 Regulator of protease activity HflC, stomatin/prohibitin superfamily [Sharpea azabuensis]
MAAFILFIVFIVLLVLFISSFVKIVPQSEAFVIERLGAYNRTLDVGLHILVPFIERVANRVSLKEQVMDFDPQPVITKDNVTMQIDTVVYFKVFDPKLFTYGVVNPINAVDSLTSTTLRNIIGDLNLDDTLTSRDTINAQMKSIIDEATDAWGIKVNRVEVKNIIPPRDIQEAMEKQMRAERQKREAILVAEGEKQSSILRAEGEKETMILRANAEKESAIAKAEGQAQAVRLLNEARAASIKMINDANPSQPYVELEGFKALEKLADGRSTKIIVPSNLSSLAGTLASAKEILTDAPQDAEINVYNVEKPEAGTPSAHNPKTHDYYAHVEKK